MNGQDKLNYLYEFERLFAARCKEAGIDYTRWARGMWTNAHMSYGNRESAEAGVTKWFAHVQNQTNRAKPIKIACN